MKQGKGFQERDFQKKKEKEACLQKRKKRHGSGTGRGAEVRETARKSIGKRPRKLKHDQPSSERWVLGKIFQLFELKRAAVPIWREALKIEK